MVDQSTILFFDASCLIAAAGSPRGGSGFLLGLCSRRLLRAAISQPVMEEAERNIRQKLRGEAMARYRALLQNAPMLLAPVPPLALRRRELRLINPKDDHVVAVAVAIHAPYLVTLDQPLVEQVRVAGIALAAMTPGEFIRDLLPSHPNFGIVRDEPRS